MGWVQAVLTPAKSGVPLHLLRNTLCLQRWFQTWSSWTHHLLSPLLFWHSSSVFLPSCNTTSARWTGSWTGWLDFKEDCLPPNHGAYKWGKWFGLEKIGLNPIDLRREQNWYSSREMPKSSPCALPQEGGESWFSKASELMFASPTCPPHDSKSFSFLIRCWDNLVLHECPALIQHGGAHIELCSETLQPQREHCPEEHLLFSFYRWFSEPLFWTQHSAVSI